MRINLSTILNRVYYFQGRAFIDSHNYTGIYKDLNKVDIKKVEAILKKKIAQNEEIERLQSQIRVLQGKIEAIKKNRVQTSVEIEELFYEGK